MDFFRVAHKENKEGAQTLYPDFLVGRSKDLMVKGSAFYAIWDEEAGLWSTDEYDVQRLVDKELYREAQTREVMPEVNYLRNFKNNGWSDFQRYVRNISDNAYPLDSKVIFANDDVKKEDYATKRLPYPIQDGDISAWDALMDVLYDPAERRKIEWAIGAIITGDSKDIQKFLVFYGPPGTGKSTVLNIIQKLFQGYLVMFDAKALGSNSNQFATEVFKGNPLIAIQHDGDLSRIEDNSKLNSIISHEEMVINEKFKSSYTARFNAFLFMGTNQPVKISDAKSGLIRRLIDVEPTGKKLDFDTYQEAMSKIDFQLGAIAQHCKDVYLKLGFGYYNDYRPIEMMYKTDHVLNFVADHYDIFRYQEYTTVKQAYDLYKVFCEDYGFDHPMTRQRFQAELDNYFKSFHDVYESSEGTVRNVFTGFDMNKVEPLREKHDISTGPVLRVQPSRLDEVLSSYPAQYTKDDGTPQKRWSDVTTTLSDIDTRELHYVKVPENHIVIDFDLKDDDGNKDLEKNLEAASLWPETYTEVSKSGEGVHLHYIYNGDVSQLSNVYSEGIEVKVYKGNSSLRRKLTKCNDHEVSSITGGLPLKEKKVIEERTIKSEKGLRSLIDRNLRKEIHPGTKPSVEFIKKILDDAYEDGMTYDVSDMRPAVIIFAKNSTNHSADMLKLVTQMKFKSEEDVQADPSQDHISPQDIERSDSLAFFDVEVYPNLFLIVWKYEGEDASPVVMLNPSPQDVEALFKLKLVGFNNRRYDNHILYGRYLGYSNEALYELSQKIINNDRQATFAGAYGISYADIYDFSSKKQGLKQFEIDLGITHMEMEIPWDQPVPDEMVDKVIEYCKNDVYATEKVFESRKADYIAREILADLSGLSINDTTQKHTAQIIFEGDKNANKKFKYTDLSKDFPGYRFDSGKSYYKDEKVNEGGYVYAEPGMYENVAVLDIASMHPTSIEQLDLFGPYTQNFADIKAARIAIKHGDYDRAREMFDGKLAPYLKDESNAKDLAYALKIAINIVYGLTSAKFQNPFRDIRNKDNIVAKRGSLFMVDLKQAVQAKGYQVIHIKTDSIKIPNADEEIISFVTEFGKKYGYDFEHENTYDRICLVNDAVYIARTGDHWEACGAQFQHPYVYKKLFTKEEIRWDDYIEARNVKQGAMYLDMDWDTPMAQRDEKRMRFLGKTGEFVPMKEETQGAGILYRVKDDKYYAVAGTKGHIWMEAAVATQFGMDAVDTSYAEKLAKEAKEKIESFGDFEDLFR